MRRVPVCAPGTAYLRGMRTAPRRRPGSRLRPPAHPVLPTSPGFWRSPLRGPWFTSVLGLVLLFGLLVVFVTGLLSYAAYNPSLSPVNDKTPDKGVLGFYLFDWPTDPHWLYRLTQGVHVTLGLALIPVVLAKLWSVVPRLWSLPPVRSLAHGAERLSLLLLVGGVLFQFATGVLNIQLDYLFPGSFYPLHFYGAWVFFAAFALHAALRVPQALRTLRSGELRTRGTRDKGDAHRDGERDEDEDGSRTDAGTHAGPTPHGAGAHAELLAPATGLASTGAELRSPDPDPGTLTRRGALGVVGAGSALLVVTTVGQSIGGPLRETALFAPHGGGEPGGGPGGFQINKTMAAVGVRVQQTGEAWRLAVEGRAGTVRLSRADLLAMRQYGAALPIACVEGWSTPDQDWRGVRLRDLAGLAGYRDGPLPDLLVESLQTRGAFRRAALRANQVADPRSLLALAVNGAPLTPDHGFPARVIVPAAPGVLNTKWVARLTFGDLT
ncbi:molybdopterin-dependent oxidoreductase [Streptomyces sp. LD120]|uniref:Molybdopterin-dependent oxidoreductase n=2 Tax=Streptomyces physcomitrii TaxID=2724184 RepID=A0ABX1GY58_9ACTN|nr:molybdopterin-dependent oxidoreductase [Streptomyces physcomitrii]